MSVLDRFRGAMRGFRMGASALSDLRHPSAWLTDWASGGPTVSGVSVNSDGALTLSSYFAAIRAISEDVAKLPVHEYRREGRGREQVATSTVERILGRDFNPTLCAQAGRELLIQWALAGGIGLAEIVRDDTGKAAELWPIHFSRVEPVLEGRQLFYDIQLDQSEDGSARKVRLPARDAFVVRGLGDRLRGYSVAKYARETLGLSISAQDFGAALFGNDTTLGVILSHPGVLRDAERKNLQEAVQAARGRAKDAFKFMVLEGGTKVERVGIPPEDAQFLETRAFQVLEIARWFRIPPHKIASMEHATFTNIEHQSLEYVQDTLLPWLIRVEKEADRKLIGTRNQSSRFVRHSVEGLLRGDFKTRMEGHAIAINNGIRTPNEVRALEDLNESTEDGASLLWMQGAMSTVEKLSEPEPEPAPVPPGLMPGLPDSEDEAAEEVEDEEARARPLLERAAARIARRETNALRKPLERLTDLAHFNDWRAGFYRGHLDYAEAELGPIAEAFGLDLSAWLAVWVDGRLEAAAEAFRRGHGAVEESEPEYINTMVGSLMALGPRRP